MKIELIRARAWRTGLAAVVIASLLLASAPKTDAPAAKKSPCPRRGVIVVANSTAHVIAERILDTRVLSVCWLADGRTRRVGVWLDPQQGIGKFRQAGRFVAYELFNCPGPRTLPEPETQPPGHECSYQVIARDQTTIRASPGARGRVQRLVLAPSGVAAWTRKAADGMVDVQLLRGTETATLASGAIDPHSVALAGRWVFWVAQGEGRVADLGP